jgi:hypothetical protein
VSKELEDTISSLPPRPSSGRSIRATFVQTVRPVLDGLNEADALAGDVQKILSSMPPPPVIPRAPRMATGTGQKKKS